MKYFDDNIPEASQDKIKRGRLLKQAFPQRRKRKHGKNLENPSQEYHYHGVTTVTMLTDISEEAMLLFDGNADVSPVRNEEEIQRIVAGLDVHITKVDNEENLVRIALEKANEDKVIVYGPVTETLHPPGDFWRPLFLETLAIGLLKSGCLQKSQCWMKP